jgi:hypothetical protein
MAHYNNMAHKWPSINFLPLRFLRVQPGKKPDAIMDTIGLKRVAVSKDLFQIPKDFKETQDERDTGVNTSDLKDIIQDMGIGEDKRRK